LGFPTTSKAWGSSPKDFIEPTLVGDRQHHGAALLVRASHIVLKKCQFSLHGAERSKITTSGLCSSMEFIEIDGALLQFREVTPDQFDV
jgi:hypothetical protein